MKFQLVVIIILGVLLIITLLSFYYIATRSGDDIPFPPSIPICPDYYYQVHSNDGKIRCKAMPSIAAAIDAVRGKDDDFRKGCKNPAFFPRHYSGTNANCEKYKWYAGCNYIPAWEGVTYGVQNPCATT